MCPPSLGFLSTSPLSSTPAFQAPGSVTAKYLCSQDQAHEITLNLFLRFLPPNSKCKLTIKFPNLKEKILRL